MSIIDLWIRTGINPHNKLLQDLEDLNKPFTAACGCCSRCHFIAEFLFVLITNREWIGEWTECLFFFFFFSNIIYQFFFHILCITSTYQAMKWDLTGSDDEEREGYTCAVCLDVYYSPYKCHPCSHVFCEPCLRTLAKNRPSNTLCPLCRTLISHVLFQEGEWKR